MLKGACDKAGVGAVEGAAVEGEGEDEEGEGKEEEEEEAVEEEEEEEEEEETTTGFGTAEGPPPMEETGMEETGIGGGKAPIDLV
eukprot:CAMPEP_0175057428 /NCGR_PEP_ID=MMETSP0052_2-20121109/11257_1 /TAXON_ID=51329 ORGANISM="Polytomella parva, Strain SAG 63-3" /NCGR_SAMPLE_ID=MMETSP0052_2 /ASSEMBLY_ACC=CAM_ASM_000194 /LENGTH=84 /DNA_ID=CAMNT_0016322637 /DNA_START=333 /DNA_END=587 /DNA_ORIENTATION=-